MCRTTRFGCLSLVISLGHRSLRLLVNGTGVLQFPPKDLLLHSGRTEGRTNSIQNSLPSLYTVFLLPSHEVRPLVVPVSTSYTLCGIVRPLRFIQIPPFPHTPLPPQGPSNKVLDTDVLCGEGFETPDFVGKLIRVPNRPSP